MMNPLMMLLTTYGGSAAWDAVARIFNHFFQALIPIGICVILPIIVITLALRTRRHEIDKKTEVMMKAIENGAQLDPAFFESAAKAGCKEKTVKDKLMGYLTAACVTSAIGLLAGIVLTIVFTSQNLWNDEPGGATVAILPCAILLAVGIAFFIVYAIGKKTWAKELAELDAKKPEEYGTLTREEFIGLAMAEQESLRRFLLSLCGDPAEADDIAQDALMNAYVASASFRGAARFSTWLFRIAYNCFIDRVRKRKIQTSPLDHPAAQAVPGAEATDGRFRHEDLHRAIGQLPDKERAALLLFYMEDKPVKEIAAILEMPSGSVRAYLSRGRQHVKNFLEKWKTR